MRILFILKRGGSYGYPSPVPSSGLFNSIRFMVEMLNKRLRQKAKMVVVPDNNRIDHEVHKFRPDIVVIEALWVVPEKFDVLKKLHPSVHWIVRIHSALPFLAGEGNSIDWILRCASQDRVTVAANDLRTAEELSRLLEAAGIPEPLLYLPNFYPTSSRAKSRDPVASRKTPLHISCFGSIRPLKNHLTQAVAAIQFAEELRLPLRFHINSTRLEGGGEPILKNLRLLFSHLPRHELIEHPWLPHHHFIKLVRRMTAGLQVSFSETFNIVAADHAANGVPLFASKEIPWIAPQFAADPNDSRDIVCKLREAIATRRHHENMRRLRKFSETSVQLWAQLVGCR
jgi:glycosyltransferase involved in cell wall biosynthesis